MAKGAWMFFKRLRLASHEQLCQCEPCRCRRSSVVEHTLGKGEVESSILSGGTIASLSFVFLCLFTLKGHAQELTEAVCRDLIKRDRNDPNYSPERSASKYRPADLGPQNQLPSSLKLNAQEFMGYKFDVKTKDLNQSSNQKVPVGVVIRCKKLYPSLK